MEADSRTLGDIFRKDIRHIVPLYQRPYVWEREKQWEPLWEDIRAVAERLFEGRETRPHFLGAIVLDQLRSKSGDTEQRLVIDGQQRLTTIQVALEAFCDIAAAQGFEKYHRSLLKLTRNDDPQTDEPDLEFKVWPTNVDRDHFRLVMKAEGPAAVRLAYKASATALQVGHPIADAYLYFHREIHAWISAEGDLETRTKALYEALRTRVRLVVIDLDRDDDAQLIFETMNARGTPLLPADLIKNFLFLSAPTGRKDLTQLYEAHWKPFDAESRWWREEVAAGRVRRSRIDILLQHYLSLKEKDEVLLAHLYDSFRKHAEKREGGPLEVLKEVRAYGDIFRGFGGPESTEVERGFFRRLEILDTTTAYPFLLELYARHGASKEIVHPILRCLESFLVRRTVCRLTTKAYNRFFLDLLGVLIAEAGDPSAGIEEFLRNQTSESTRWPEDDEFRASWTKDPLYELLVRRRLRMILEAVEQASRSGKSEKVTLSEKLTIEHLMPQRWREKWAPPEGGVEAVIERDRSIHSIGNLTLVTGKLNPALGNETWPRKREELRKHSWLSLNLALQSHESWDDQAIRDRGEELFRVAASVWPRPKGSSGRQETDAVAEAHGRGSGGRTPQEGAR